MVTHHACEVSDSGMVMLTTGTRTRETGNIEKYDTLLECESFLRYIDGRSRRWKPQLLHKPMLQLLGQVTTCLDSPCLCLQL
jgi:hypothetical protein